MQSGDALHTKPQKEINHFYFNCRISLMKLPWLVKLTSNFYGNHKHSKQQFLVSSNSLPRSSNQAAIRRLEDIKNSPRTIACPLPWTTRLSCTLSSNNCTICSNKQAKMEWNKHPNNVRNLIVPNNVTHLSEENGVHLLLHCLAVLSLNCAAIIVQLPK